MNPEASFLALAARPGEMERLQCLSGSCMEWRPQVWLFDLAPFLGYWHQRARQQKLPLSQLWRNILAWNFGQESHFQGDYRAAVASHPWRALLLLEAMTQAQHHGLAVETGQRGSSLLNRLSWGLWVQAARGMADPWQASKRKGFQPPRFRKQLERLQTTMLRLGIERPLASGNLNQPALASRFGAEVALLWSWTQHPPDDLKAFPWQELQHGEPRAIRRTTDYPLKQWDQIYPLLREDLDRLQALLQGRAELVRQISWELLLENDDPMPLLIGFRSPHDLNEEAGEHKTLLTRLQKALEQAMAQRMEGRSHLEAPWVTGWNLVLEQSLLVPDQVLDIFGQVQEQESAEEQLAKLENLLPMPLRRYAPQPDWEPESAWQPWPGPVPSPLLASLAEAAKLRPLFHFPKAQPLGGEPEGRLDFLEEASGKWWRKAAGEERRSYYKWTDEKGQAWWLFHDDEDNWFVQGRYD